MYVLLCDQKIYYIGITNNIVRRFLAHINKKTFFTKKFSDLKFVYAEKYNSKYKAARREKQLKKWNKTKKQLLIEGRLGINTCTGPVEVLLRENENLVSLLRA